MCLICCCVRIWTAPPCRPCLCEHPGYNRRNHTWECTWRGHRKEMDDAGKCAAATAATGPVHETRPHNSGGVWSPSTDNRITEGDYGPQNTTVLACSLWSYEDRNLAADADQYAKGSEDEARGLRIRWGSLGSTHSNDPRCRRFWGGSPRFEDTASECLHCTSQSCSGCSPGSAR